MAQFLVPALYGGTTTLTSAADGSLAVALPAASGLTTVGYAGDPAPSLPAGAVGLLVDTVAGSLFAASPLFAGAVVATTGAAAVQAGAAQAQRFLLSPAAGDGPVAFAESGGSGTVYAGGYGQQDGVLYRGYHGSYAFGGGAYSLYARSWYDTVVAAGGTGLLVLQGESDVVSLGDGSYSVASGPGAIVAGGNGSDVYSAFGGEVLLGGGANQASISGVATLFGGSGSARVEVVQGGGLIVNGSGRMAVALDAGSFETQFNLYHGETVFGGTGSVTVAAGAAAGGVASLGGVAMGFYTGGTVAGAADVVVGGAAGQNRITARSNGASVFGGGDGDVLSVWNNPLGGDVIVAGPGAETLLGGGGDGPAGGSGGNLLVGGTGSDMILGGLGHDTILAGSGATTLATGLGGSLVRLGAGPALAELTGADTLLAGSGTATIGAFGGAVVFGGAGAFTFSGIGASTVAGGTGSRTIYAGVGGGVFAGGSGTDVFLGGAGSSVFFAGTGDTTFVFAASAGAGIDAIAGFDARRDHVSLRGYAPGTAAASLAAATVAGGSTTIALPDATRITFFGLASLDPSAIS